MEKPILFTIIILSALIYSIAHSAQESTQARTPGQLAVSSYCLDPSSWPADQKDVFQKRCDKMSQMLETQQQKKSAGEKWIIVHGKSDLMGDIFRGYRDRIPKETLGADEIKWVFELGYVESGNYQCREYVFGLKGELRNSQEYDCPQ